MILRVSSSIDRPLRAARIRSRRIVSSSRRLILRFPILSLRVECPRDAIICLQRTQTLASAPRRRHAALSVPSFAFPPWDQRWSARPPGVYFMQAVKAESMMQGLFWFTAIFGVGVTVIDLLGLIGSGGQADGGSAAEAADDGSGEEGGGEDGGGAPVLSFLRYVRTAIYFCLGFGPFGLASTAFGSGPAGSLIWALAGGTAVATLARLFFRLQRTELDSSIKEEELLFEQATVDRPDRRWRHGQGTHPPGPVGGGALRAGREPRGALFRRRPRAGGAGHRSVRVRARTRSFARAFVTTD